MKKIMLAIFSILLLTSFISAGLRDEVNNEIINSQENFKINQEECNSLMYKTVIKIFDGLVFEILEENDHFYLVFQVKNCELNISIEEESKRIDILIDVINEDIKTNSLRGRIFMKLIKKYQ